MIDTRGHEVCLGELRAAFAATAFADPGLAQARDDVLADVAQRGAYATLGAFLDHVVAHAVSDGTEVALLERAASLWKRGVDVYDVVGGIRTDLEAALSDPADPDSATRFNTIALRVHTIAKDMHGLQGEAEDLRQDLTKLGHLPEHPRQEDKSVEAWDWANLLGGRRTDAFVRSVFRHAAQPEERAFSFGVLSRYAANGYGSAYIGRVVGGPRRSHRFRDRLARRAIGSWLSANRGGLPSLGGLADSLAFGNVDDPRLPASVDTLVQNALAETYDLARSPAVPDLALGHRRLVRQLQLLDDFRTPPIPAMPSGVWPARIFGDPGIPPPPSRPQIVPLSDDTGGGGGGDLGTITVAGGNDPGDPQPDKTDSKSVSGTACAIIAVVATLFAIALVSALVSCVIQWARGEKCNYFETLWDIITLEWTGITQTDPPDPGGPPDMSQSAITGQGLAAFAPTAQAAQLVYHVWDLHVQVWEALDHAHDYLSVTGMIYPDGRLAQPRFRQFLSGPPAADWPHRADADPHHTYHLFPSSPLENPVTFEGAFAGQAPDAPFSRSGPAAARAIGLWTQIVGESLDSSNLDLDADRGYEHSCWATERSIDDDPLGVRVLAYDEQ